MASTACAAPRPFGETTSFSYDALGRRIAKRSSHATTLFDWDGDTLAFESTQSTEGQQEQAWRGDRVHYLHAPRPQGEKGRARDGTAHALQIIET
jgi:YD repeat-containing protein